MIALSLGILVASSAWAQKASSNQAFNNLDKNRDGFLSRDEAAPEKELAKRFSRFDANRDGKLSEDEYLKAMQDNDKRVLSDSTITTKVKTALLTEKGIPSMAISVETYESTVQLSGFVESNDVKAKAGRLAAGVSGVKQVQNNLVVK